MNVRPLLSSLGVSLLLWAVPAAAQEAPAEQEAPKDSKLALRFRVAYGIPKGDTFQGKTLEDTFGTTVAPQIEFAYFFNSKLTLGLYFQFGRGDTSEACFEALCGATVARLGIDLDYHFRPGAFVSPWVGVGVGYEMASVDFEAPEGRGELASLALKGFDLGHANLGVDLRLTRTVSVGPYISASLGQYFSADTSVDGVGDADTSIPGSARTLHVWLQPGVRVQFRL
jgi:outer membrane protein W